MLQVSGNSRETLHKQRRTVAKSQPPVTIVPGTVCGRRYEARRRVATDITLAAATHEEGPWWIRFPLRQKENRACLQRSRNPTGYPIAFVRAHKTIGQCDGILPVMQRSHMMQWSRVDRFTRPLNALRGELAACFPIPGGSSPTRKLATAWVWTIARFATVPCGVVHGQDARLFEDTFRFQEVVQWRADMFVGFFHLVGLVRVDGFEDCIGQDRECRVLEFGVFHVARYDLVAIAVWKLRAAMVSISSIWFGIKQ
jgi:hypothetical protein